MGSLTRRATTLIREVLTTGDDIPAYNEEVIRVTVDQMEQCQASMQELSRQAKESASRRGGEEDTAFEWSAHPEHFAAVIIHHETIIKLKRILLTYMKLRADCLRHIRWDQQRLPAEVKENLCPAEIEYYKEYDRVLNKYMKALDMDLATDMAPPRDASIRVRVMRDHGALSMSASTKVDLVKGSVHSMARGEAERLIRMGVLRAVDNY